MCTVVSTLSVCEALQQQAEHLTIVSHPHRKIPYTELKVLCVLDWGVNGPVCTDASCFLPVGQLGIHAKMVPICVHCSSLWCLFACFLSFFNHTVPNQSPPTLLCGYSVWPRRWGRVSVWNSFPSKFTLLEKWWIHFAPFDPVSAMHD